MLIIQILTIYTFKIILISVNIHEFMICLLVILLIILQDLGEIKCDYAVTALHKYTDTDAANGTRIAIGTEGCTKKKSGGELIIASMS